MLVCLYLPFRWCPVLLCHLPSVQGEPFRAVQGEGHGHGGAVQGWVRGKGGRGWVRGEGRGGEGVWGRGEGRGVGEGGGRGVWVRVERRERSVDEGGGTIREEVCG